MVHEFTYLTHLVQLWIRWDDKIPREFENMEVIDQEIYRITKVCQDVAVSGNKCNHAYFTLHQKQLIDFIDTLNSEELKEHKVIDKKFTAKTFQAKLIIFLKWMQSDLGQYFNFDQPIPKALLQEYCSEINDKLEAIFEALRRQCYPPEVISVCKKVSSGSALNSFRDVKFQIDFLPKLISFLNVNGNSVYDIIKFLLSCGINHCAFYDLVTTHIRRDLDQQTTLTQQINTISTFRKEIRLIFMETKKDQFPDRPKIKHAVLKFIKEELLFLRTIEFMNQGLEQSGIINASYKVSLSVKKLAFFVHLQMEAGVIADRKELKIMRQTKNLLENFLNHTEKDMHQLGER